MGPSPKISILLPSYRQERFVREAVESVLMQDFPDWEMVASDDASPDGTAAILEEYARRDPRIRFCHQKSNLGMVENWNWCLREARGEAVKLMGADDRLEKPDCLSRQWAALQNPGVSLVASARRLIDEHSCAIRTESGFATARTAGPAAMNRMLETQTNLVGEPVCALFWKTAASRGFHPGYPQLADMEMWFQLLQQGDLFYEQGPLCSFRVYPNQLSQRNLQSGHSLREHVRFMIARSQNTSMGITTKRSVYFWALETRKRNPGLWNPDFEGGFLELRQQLGGASFWFSWLWRQVGRTGTRLGRSISKRVWPQVKEPTPKPVQGSTLFGPGSRPPPSSK